jgi:hypothetical protein
MNVTYSFFINLAVKVLGAIIQVISPEIRKLVQDSMQRLYDNAKQTPNPWDDFFVKLIATILGVELKD